MSPSPPAPAPPSALLQPTEGKLLPAFRSSVAKEDSASRAASAASSPSWRADGGGVVSPTGAAAAAAICGVAVPKAAVVGSKVKVLQHLLGAEKQRCAALLTRTEEMRSAAEAAHQQQQDELARERAAHAREKDALESTVSALLVKAGEWDLLHGHAKPQEPEEVVDEAAQRQDSAGLKLRAALLEQKVAQLERMLREKDFELRELKDKPAVEKVVEVPAPVGDSAMEEELSKQRALVLELRAALKEEEKRRSDALQQQRELRDKVAALQGEVGKLRLDAARGKGEREKEKADASAAAAQKADAAAAAAQKAALLRRAPAPRLEKSTQTDLPLPSAARSGAEQACDRDSELLAAAVSGGAALSDAQRAEASGAVARDRALREEAAHLGDGAAILRDALKAVRKEMRAGGGGDGRAAEDVWTRMERWARDAEQRWAKRKAEILQERRDCIMPTLVRLGLATHATPPMQRAQPQEPSPALPAQPPLPQQPVLAGSARTYAVTPCGPPPPLSAPHQPLDGSQSSCVLLQMSGGDPFLGFAGQSRGGAYPTLEQAVFAPLDATKPRGPPRLPPRGVSGAPRAASPEARDVVSALHAAAFFPAGRTVGAFGRRADAARARPAASRRRRSQSQQSGAGPAGAAAPIHADEARKARRSSTVSLSHCQPPPLPPQWDSGSDGETPRRRPAEDERSPMPAIPRDPEGSVVPAAPPAARRKSFATLPDANPTKPARVRRRSGMGIPDTGLFSLIAIGQGASARISARGGPSLSRLGDAGPPPRAATVEPPPLRAGGTPVLPVP